MSRFIYENVQCPACNRVLNEDDDIVVCPDCGTPYHRDCYKRIGKCLYEEKHNEHFESYKFCPFCRSVISMGASVCPMCKKSLIDDDQGKHVENNANTKKDKLENFLSERIKKLEEEERQRQKKSGIGKNIFDCATDEEVSAYIGGGNVYYYMSTFARITKLRLSRFNFFAFLFSGIWFLYRKQYKIGAVITAVMILLTVGSAVVENTVMSSMTNLFAGAGLDISGASFSFEDMMKLSEQIKTLSQSEQLLFFLPTLIFILKLVIMIFCGLKANIIYYNRCNNFFVGIKDDVQETSRMTKIKQYGGVNFGIAVSIYVSYWLLKFFLPNIF